MRAHRNAVVYTGFRGWAGVPGAMGCVLFDIGEIKNFAFFQTENFQKMLKSNENLIIF